LAAHALVVYELQVRQGLLVGFVVLLPFIGIVCLPAVFVMHMTPVRHHGTFCLRI
jgi:hypothetical protein